MFAPQASAFATVYDVPGYKAKAATFHEDLRDALRVSVPHIVTTRVPVYHRVYHRVYRTVYHTVYNTRHPECNTCDSVTVCGFCCVCMACVSVLPARAGGTPSLLQHSTGLCWSTLLKPNSLS